MVGVENDNFQGRQGLIPVDILEFSEHKGDKF